MYRLLYALNYPLWLTSRLIHVNLGQQWAKCMFDELLLRHATFYVRMGGEV